MAYRPFVTFAMERAVRMTRGYGILLFFFAGYLIIAWLINDLPKSSRLPVLIYMASDSLIPGITLCFLANRMNKPRLWAYFALIPVLALMLIAFFLSVGFIDAHLRLAACLILGIPLAFLFAALLNAMPNVMDAYRNHRHDRNLTKRGFEPILHTTPLPTMILPPRPTQKK